MGRFLRIGLVRDGQVLEERLVPMGVDVTIGRSSSNTFVVARGNLPKSTLAFKARGPDRHALIFTKPEGRVDLGGDEPATLAELVAKGLALKKDKLYGLPLPKTARGKFDIGDVTVLFHYVERDLAIGAKKTPAKRALVLETELSWEGTVLSVKKWDALEPVTMGPLPGCDLQLPGRVLEARAYPIIAGGPERFYVDLQNPGVTVTSLTREERDEDGKRSMKPVAELPAERFPIRGAFEMQLALGDGFTLEIRYLPAMTLAVSSPFDIQDPQPILCLAGSALLHAAIMLIAFAVGQSLLNPGEVKAAKEERRREIHTMLQQQKIEQKKEEEQTAKDESKDEEEEPDKEEEAEAKEPPKPRRTPKPRVAQVQPSTPEARRTKLRESVRKKTFLRHIGGEGQDGDGALPVGRETRYADAFQDVDVPYAANGAAGDEQLAPSGPRSDGADGVTYKTLSDEERGGRNIDTKTVKTADKGGAQEKKIRVNVRTGSLAGQSGLGQIDNNAVASVFARRKGAIKSCYERELRRNQNLAGRITLRFTIGTSGRITAISVTQNTTRDRAIETCIIGKVRNWKFERPSGGAVTFTYPFILEAR